MDRAEVREKMLVRWEPKPGDRILCRVVLNAPTCIGLRVLSATPRQILQHSYGVGETAYINPDSSVLEKAEFK